MPTISNTFGTEEPLLKDLLQHIECGKMQLPDFQRGWVWDDRRIRALIASITLGYPVGALMSMETSDTLRFSPRLFEGSSGSSAPELLLLDGQQRMTSLFLALQSKQAVPTQDEKKKKLECFYYLDMKKCLDTSVERMEAVISVPKDKIIKSNFGRTIELDISTSENEYASMMFPLNIVFDNQACWDWERGFQEFFSLDRDYASIFFSFRSEIIQPLYSYKIPVIKLSRETPKDAICQVFENVNTGGVSLTVFELLTATFAGDDFRLREDWDRRSATLRQIDGILSGVDGKDFLAAVTLLASYRRNRQHGTPISCKRGDILNLSLEEYRANADAITEGLRKAARFLHAQQIFDICNLPYQTQLIPLSAICACLENRFEDYTVKQKLARWYWCGVLGELYGSANETRYALDIQNFMNWLDADQEPVTIRDATFAPVRLLSLQTRNSAAYKGIMALMMGAGCCDFISGETIQQANYFDETVDIHHIFPADYCRQQRLPRQLWNSIVNKAPLSARTNRILGGKAPSAYIDYIEQRQHVTPDALDRHLASHFINASLLRTDDFPHFIDNRATALLDKIEEAMGKRVAGRDAEDVVRAFGRPLVHEQ